MTGMDWLVSRQASSRATSAPLRCLAVSLLVAVLLGLGGQAQAQEPGESIWHRVAPEGAIELKLYFFWSETCPHCAKAKVFLESQQDERPWLKVRAFEITRSEENRRLLAGFAAELDQQIVGVPTVFLCEQMVPGFDTAEGRGALLLELADSCRAALAKGSLAEAARSEAGLLEKESDTLDLPLLGEVSLEQVSLPLLTLVLGGLDAFNPCAFFVLLFLLSMMVHARSKPRMLLIGGTFVVISGLLYFLFMAAWLNLFLVLEGVRTVTLVAGLVATILALLNIKDFFLFKQGPSLSIPETAKPGLFARVRGLLSKESLPALFVGTVTLAVAANTYELLCTSGFPLVYTRALTLSDLRLSSYYLHLAFYNVIYVLPLLAIVTLVTFTLGGRKLSEDQGRVLKLLSGLMMLGLGLVLVFAPSLLDNWLTAVALLMLAILLTLVLYAAMRVLKARRT